MIRSASLRKRGLRLSFMWPRKTGYAHASADFSAPQPFMGRADLGDLLVNRYKPPHHVAGGIKLRSAMTMIDGQGKPKNECRNRHGDDQTDRQAELTTKRFPTEAGVKAVSHSNLPAFNLYEELKLSRAGRCASAHIRRARAFSGVESGGDNDYYSETCVVMPKIARLLLFGAAPTYIQRAEIISPEPLRQPSGKEETT